MLDCTDRPETKCDLNSDTGRNDNDALCGSSIAFPYFISFYVLCSFLVSFYLTFGLYLTFISA
jgi:hypothetical protein